MQTVTTHPDDAFCTVSTAARELRVCEATVRNLERRGELAAIRTAGGVRLFRREELARVRAERIARRVR